LIDTMSAVGSVAAVDLVVFPAGYFQVRGDGARSALIRRLRAGLRLLAPPFDVVVGIDRATDAHKVPSNGHPFFVVHRTRSGEFVSMQQVSVTRWEGAQRALVDARWDTRALLLAETEIAFLICGESWSDELLKRVAASGCRVLVVAAHRNVNLHREEGGYGKLSWHRRLESFYEEHEVPVVLAEHTRSPGRHPYSWPPDISAALAPDGVPAGVTLRLATIRK
jgi:hypothetical protein